MGIDAPPTVWSQWGARRLFGAWTPQTAKMGPCGSGRGVVSRPLQTIIGRCWRMPRHQDSTSKATGRDLIGQAQDVWQEVGGSIPPQQRQDLGQVLTELGSRINYTCTGQTTDTKSK